MGKRGSLLEAAFKNENVKQARVKKDQTVQRAVQNIIVDHFKHFSDAEVDGIQRDGLTLRQRLIMDKERKNSDKNNVMGARYYKELKQIYSSSTNPLRLLVVSDDSTPSKELFDAMLLSKRHPCNRQPMIQYLLTADLPNMSEAIGIFKWCLELNPMAGTDQLRGVLEVMKWSHRLKLATTFDVQLSHLNEKFNEALVQAQGSALMCHV